jgi:hypothetical protein
MSLHVHAQQVWHDGVYLVGTAESLRALSATIEQALANQSSVVTLLAGDGEGYDLNVFVRGEAYMDTQAALPYTDMVARESRRHVTYPWKEAH